ncbi:hypothetical protein ACGC1H_006776 [Rhizoctonia solani]|uniref:Uncharacterized protein n=1 Tax=Rhizoctonia solani TaxID=456999 RepID=A0A8H2XVF1_9AGAM|nr:unnamed protein product [Rhizoctonia solani]
MTAFNFALLAHSRASLGISMRLVPVTAIGARHLSAVPYSNPRRSLHMTAHVKSPTTEQDSFARSHLVSFFAQYPDFKYDQSKPFMDEFWRLVETHQFGRRGKRYKSARKGVKEAILLQFKDIYGAHSCNIQVWHNFFKAIGIDEMPRDIGLCHRQAKSIHLNICDLIDKPVTGIDIQKFPNVLELSRYTLKDDDRPKIVPPISRKQDPIVGRLFRQVSNPPKPNAATAAKDAREMRFVMMVFSLVYFSPCSTPARTEGQVAS